VSQQPPDRPPEGWQPPQQPPPAWDRPPDRPHEPPGGWGPPPQPPDQEPPGGVRSFFRRYPLAFFGGILLIMVLLATVFGGNDEGTDTASQQTEAPATAAPATAPEAASTVEPQPEADASTQASCQHFRNVIGDVGQGVLSDAELRDKFKEVNDSASVSERADIRAGGVAMLRAITTGTTEDLLKAVGQFDKACDRAGQ
jgi:hypothetical protein